MTSRHILSALALALAAALGRGTAPPPPPPPAPAGGVPAAVARLINAERVRAHLAPLEVSRPVALLAQSWAASMASADVLTHGTYGDRIAQTFPGHAAGEDVAAGRPDPASVVAAWMSSPPHRANILGPFRWLGVGEAVSPRGVPYWCVDFLR